MVLFSIVKCDCGLKKGTQSSKKLNGGQVPPSLIPLNSVLASFKLTIIISFKIEIITNLEALHAV